MKSRLLNFIILLLAGSLFTGCTTYVEMADLNLPEKNPPKPEEVSSLSFALAEPEITINTKLTTYAESGLIDRILADGKTSACHLNNEIDKILLSKGFTITDRFQGLDHMTFTQKRNTSALFYPEIVLEIKEKSQHENFQFLFFWSNDIRGRMQIEATVNIVMKEPLSDEKIWVKSLPIENIDVNVDYKPVLYGGVELNGFFVPKNLQPLAVKVDRMFEKISADVLDATEKYVERQEFEFLNDDIARLKGIKRY